MLKELKYLTEKIDEIENEISYYYRTIEKTESEVKKGGLNNLLQLREIELEILQNILYKLKK
tara:strand:+ start:19 stop:204 length:186 start_codon:yes stop_codon:yes gene_type:complete